MPKTPTDYSKAIIYKIEHINNPELLYVGSTTHFINRKSEHKTACNNEKNKHYTQKIYQMIRDNGNWESFKIMIIKEFPCNSKTELLIEEEKHRKELQATLNSIRAYRTNEEAIIYNQEYYKEYNKNNQEYYKEYNIEYYDNNKEIIKKQTKQYYNNNKEIISELRKEKMTCHCGSIFRISDKLKHLKTDKHKKFIEQIKEN